MAADIKRVIHETVDLDNPILKTILRDVFVTESKNAHEFRIKVTRGGEPIEMGNVIVSGFFMRYRDNVSCVLHGSVENGEIVLTLSPECYEMRTIFSVTIAVEDGETRTAVFVGEGQMSTNRGETIYDPNGIVPSLQDILSQYNLMVTVNAEATAAAKSAAQASVLAQEEASKATEAAAAIDGMTVSATEGYIAEAKISDVGGVKHIVFTLPKGAPGKPFKVLGTYATLDDLNASVSVREQGDIYNVGAAEPYRLYMWDTTGGTGHWLYLGELGSGGSGTVQSVDGVLADEDGNVPLNAVRYDGQQLTEEQQTAARTTLSVYSKSEIDEKTSAMLRFRHQFDIPAQPWVKVNDYYRIETLIDFESMGLTEGAYEQIRVAANDDRVDIQVYPIPLHLPEYAECGIWLYNCTFTSSGPAFLFYAKQVPSSFIVVNLRMEVY